MATHLVKVTVGTLKQYGVAVVCFAAVAAVEQHEQEATQDEDCDVN